MLRLSSIMLLLVLTSLAQAKPTLEKVRMGFPSAQGDITRNGFWLPVRVDLKASGGPVPASVLELETTDGEGAIFRVHASVLPLEANEQKTVFAYTRPGSAASALTIRWKTMDNQTMTSLTAPTRASVNMAGPRDFVIALAGTPLPAIKEAASMMAKTDGNKPVSAERQARKFVDLATLNDLPDQPMGYDAIDTMILSSKSKLASDLLGEPSQSRIKAMSTWVLGGGKLLIDSGSAYEVTRNLITALGSDACSIPGMDRREESLRALNGLNRWVTPLVGQLLPVRVKELVVLKPGALAHTLIREPSEPSDPVERPILVQVPRARGRILLFALSLDAPPFSTWEGQKSFFDRLLVELSPRNPGFAPGKFPQDSSTPRTEVAAELMRSLETFEEIPVFPFGWVALLIFAYICIIGPVDYLITQRWLNRPGLTWFTFPLIVAASSLGALATAEAFKGHQARVNKLDLLDVDQSLGLAQGSSWFSFFNPEPGEYEFAVAAADPWGGRNFLSTPRLSTLEPPDRNFRGGSRTLFRTPYEYSKNFSTMEHFGIPGWATATLDAQWSARPDTLPLAADLRHSRIDRTTLIGTITNNLPVAIEEATLFYHDAWYTLGKLQPGESRRIDMIQLGGRGLAVQTWFDARVLGKGPTRAVDPQSFSLQRLMKATLFHAHPEASDALFNSMTRNLDQSWRMRQVAETFLDANIRIRHADEVILVGRSSAQSQPINTTITRKSAPVHASSSQETFIRAIFPVKQDGPVNTDKQGGKP